MARISINSAYSAQGSNAKVNPFVRESIGYISEHLITDNGLSSLKVADQGCGMLRHLDVFSSYFNNIYFIDTEFQIKKTRKLFGTGNTSVKDYVEGLNITDKNYSVLSSEEFDSTNLDLDIIFNICVFDVETPKTRKAITTAAYNNLKDGGLFVVIIPRNDSSITKRCTDRNKYADGHYFGHHGTYTYYKNFKDEGLFIKSMTKSGFHLVKDLSKYRQIAIIFDKAS